MFVGQKIDSFPIAFSGQLLFHTACTPGHIVKSQPPI